MQDLISIQDVEDHLGLGPNGALVYCQSFLHSNIDWLLNKISESDADYFIIDTPGQVETYSIDTKLKEILEKIKAKAKIEFTCVHLTDSQYCTDTSLFISAMLVALAATVNLEMPFINILSKMDLLNQYGELPFPLEFYTEEFEPDKLYSAVSVDSSEFGKKYGALTKELCNLVNGYGLVAFTPLDVTDKQSMSNILQIVDKANGYALKSFVLGSDVLDITGHEMIDHETTGIMREKYEDN